VAASTGGTPSRHMGPAEMLGDLCRRNRNAGRALEHHRAALSWWRKNIWPCTSAPPHSPPWDGPGGDGRNDEAQTSLEEAVRISRQWGLKGSLSPSLF